MSNRYQSRHRWSPDRPEILVVCCSDGRWHSQIEDYIEQRLSSRSDLYAVPGGPVGLDWWISSLDENRAAEASFRFLVDNHRLRSVVLIAHLSLAERGRPRSLRWERAEPDSHQDCAWYRTRHPYLKPDEVRRRQVEDMERCRSRIHEWYPSLPVELIYAALDDGTVTFTPAAL